MKQNVTYKVSLHTSSSSLLAVCKELVTPKLPYGGNRIVTSVCTKLSQAGINYVATLFTRRLSVVVFIFYFSQSSPSGSLNIIIPSLSIFSHISVETKYHVHTYKLLQLYLCEKQCQPESLVRKYQTSHSISGQKSSIF